MELSTSVPDMINPPLWGYEIVNIQYEVPLIRIRDSALVTGLLVPLASDAPTPAEAAWCRHLSPVKDIKIFLRGTPKVFPLRRFIVRNATRPTLALKKKSKYLRTLNILLAGGFSPKAKFPAKPHIFSCLGAKLDPDCYSLIYQYSIMIYYTFARFLMPCPASGRRAYQSCRTGNRQLACLSSHTNRCVMVWGFQSAMAK
jgi:hypothetical protein